MSSRIKIEDIQKEIAQYGWKLISDKYENLDSELIFKCAEGHTIYAPWRKLRTKCECPICKKKWFFIDKLSKKMFCKSCLKENKLLVFIEKRILF